MFFFIKGDTLYTLSTRLGDTLYTLSTRQGDAQYTASTHLGDSLSLCKNDISRGLNSIDTLVDMLTDL
jgi:hypothetical protein